MKKLCFLFVAAVLSAVPGRGQKVEPLILLQTIELPEVPEGPYTDHLCVDTKGHRLFTTMQAQKAVVVVSLDSGKVLQNIPVGNPHSCAYRSDLEQLYVADGDPAQPGVKIFSTRDYQLVKAIGLEKRSDSMVYDANSKYLYVVNGGAGGKLDYSLISIINTTTSERVGDVKVASEVLEDMDIDPSGSRLYITEEDANKVVVVDPKKRTVLETWPITKGSTPVATAVDEAHHRLFVACRSSDLHGVIVVMDAKTGKELNALPIDGWLDYLVFDAKSGRIYAVCGLGHVYVYQQRAADSYTLLEKAETALLAKTGLLVPELDRFYVAVPMMAWKPARILVFQVK
jgi:YVTN family beta-propeller protein